MDNTTKHIYDVIIIGGGPGGVSAALYAATGGLSVVILHNGASALGQTTRIVNYYGVGSISGAELYARGLDSVRELGVKTVECEATFVSGVTDEFTVSTTAGEFCGKRLVVATGAVRKRSGIPDIEKYEGKGVSYCAVCDRFFYRKKTVGVVGTGEFALHEYNALKATAAQVYLFTNGEKTDLDVENIVTQNIVRLVDNVGRVGGVELCDGRIVPLDGLFVALGVAGGGDIAKSMGVFTDERGAIKVDGDCMTNIAGLYAVGDCTPGIKQITKAATDGMRAGTAIVRGIKHE